MLRADGCGPMKKFTTGLAISFREMKSKTEMGQCADHFRG
jgi:hypothetical protein